MEVDPSDIDALSAFLDEYDHYTTYELAQLVDRSPSTIRKWRKKCNKESTKMPFANAKRPKPKKKQVTLVTDPDIWDNQEWFEEQYYEKGHGIPTIAKIIGRSVSLVVKRFDRYSIQTRSYRESMASKNPCCNKKWLMENYADRDQYLEWCQEHGVEPISDGGRGRTLAECAEEAGVVPYTIYNWLVKFRVSIRDINEAMVGERNPFFGRRHTEETKRKIREAQKKRNGHSGTRDKESSTASSRA